MGTIQPRSPVFRLLRNLALLWFLGSLLGIGLTIVFGGYALLAECSGSLLGCLAGVSVGLLAFAASAVTAGIVLAFMQLFYMAGARTSGPGRYSLADGLVDAFDGDGDGGGDGD